MNDKQLIQYARLVLLRGVNLKEDQDLVINAPVSAQDFVRALTQEAYRTFKSGTVHVNWQDPFLSRYAYAHAKEAVLQDVPDYVLKRMEDLTDRKAAFLTVATSTPGLMQGLDQKRIQQSQKALAPKMRPYQEKIIRNLKWSVVAYPSILWAKKVYPDKDDSDALIQLFEDLITIMRLDRENPIKEWTDHLNTLEKRRRKLNEYRFERLKYKSETMDLTIELPDEHIWISGAQKRGEDIFLPNMPSEEIFTAPVKTGVNGTLKLTKSLNVRGVLVEPFTMKLRYGEIIETDCEGEQKKVIDHLLNVDKGARYLGEVGLVPQESPINQLGRVYYQNLLDENASCHFAIGNAYPMTVKSKGLSVQEIADTHNINRSLVHVDFMVGSDDLTITGVTRLGDEVPVFENGTWTKHFD